MRSMKKILAVIVLAAIPVAAVAAPAEAVANKGKSPVTVAEFAAMLAASNGLDAGNSAELLVRAGVPAADLQAPLTEGRMAEILKHYGVAAATANPAAPVSRERAEASLVLVPSGLSTLGAASIAPGPGSLDDCLVTSKNHGSCVNCCKDLGLASKACSRFCASFTGKKSTSEPLP